MPIGYDCEFASFDACVTSQQAKGHSLEQAKRICGAIQRDTEASCAKKVISSKLDADVTVEKIRKTDDGGWQVSVSTPMSHDMARTESYLIKFDAEFNRVGDNRV